MPGSAVIVAIYACAVTCSRSFAVLSVWGVLIRFWSVLVLSSTHLSLLLLSHYYCLYYYYYWSLLLLLLPQSSWLCVMGAWAGAGYGGRGSWLGCRQRRLLGSSFYLDLGSAAPVPFLGTQPSCVTQALTFEKTILQNSIEQSYQTALQVVYY